MAVKSSGKAPTKPLTKSDKKGKVPNDADPSDTLEVEAPPKKKRRILKVLLVLLILLLLLGVGFGVGIYLKLFDIQKTAEDLNLQNSPIIGRFFQKPKTNFETTDLTPGEPVQPSPGNSLAETQGAAAANGQALANSPVPGVIADPNLAKLAKQRQQEENKKISKLARLYGEMKPAEAVPIMSKLDDQTIVKILSKMEEDQAAKVLAQFDAARAAQLSQSMLNAPTDINSATTPNAGAEVAPAANTP